MSNMAKPIFLIISFLIIAVFVSGCTNEKASLNNTGYDVKIITHGDWKGSIEDANSRKTIEGTNDRTIHLDKIEGTLVITINSKYGSLTSLYVEILKDGKSLRQESTSGSKPSLTLTYRPGIFG